MSGMSLEDQIKELMEAVSTKANVTRRLPETPVTQPAVASRPNTPRAKSRPLEPILTPHKETLLRPPMSFFKKLIIVVAVFILIIVIIQAIRYRMKLRNQTGGTGGILTRIMSALRRTRGNNTTDTTTATETNSDSSTNTQSSPVRTLEELRRIRRERNNARNVYDNPVVTDTSARTLIPSAVSPDVPSFTATENKNGEVVVEEITDLVSEELNDNELDLSAEVVKGPSLSETETQTHDSVAIDVAEETALTEIVIEKDPQRRTSKRLSSSDN